MKTKSSKELLRKKLEKKSFAKAYSNADFLVKIGVAISKAREHAGLSQSQLAKILKTTQSVISRIENGNQNISLTLLTEIVRVLKCRFSVAVDDYQIAA